MSFGEQEIFRECEQGAANGSMFLFEMHLVGECEEEMARLYFMADKIYPVTIGAVLYQEEKIIVLSVWDVEMGAVTYGGAIDFFDLKKVVSVRAGLTERIMRNALFLSEVVQWNELVCKGKTTGNNDKRVPWLRINRVPMMVFTTYYINLNTRAVTKFFG